MSVMKHDRARVAVAGVRLVMGTAALVVPELLAGRMGVDPDRGAAAFYPLRMFGVRTVVIGAELLSRDPAVRRRAVRVAPLVHLADTAAAALSGLRGNIPPRAAVSGVAISSLNSALAIHAYREQATAGVRA